MRGGSDVTRWWNEPRRKMIASGKEWEGNSERGRGCVWPGVAPRSALLMDYALGRGRGRLRHTSPSYQLEFLRLNHWLRYLKIRFWFMPCFDLIREFLDGPDERTGFNIRTTNNRILINYVDLNFFSLFMGTETCVFREGGTWKICSCFHIKPICVLNTLLLCTGCRYTVINR